MILPKAGRFFAGLSRECCGGVGWLLRGGEIFPLHPWAWGFKKRGPACVLNQPHGDRVKTSPSQFSRNLEEGERFMMGRRGL